MTPPPTNLSKLVAMEIRNPFSTYNLLLAGSEGTSKKSFAADLTNHEMWSVSYWLFTRPFVAAKVGGDSITALSDKKLSLDLRRLSILSDRELIQQFGPVVQKKDQDLLLWLRHEKAFAPQIPRKISW